MRVFLTGATGFLGCEITKLLLERGHRCAILSRGADLAATRLAPLSDRVDVIRGDLFSPESYRAELSRFAPDALIHCAWRGVAGGERNDLSQLDNLAATGRLVEAAVASGATVVIGVGSQAEYGPKADAIREDAAAEPTTLYGIAKLAAGRALLNIAAERGVRGAWGRVFSLYGPGDDGPWLVPSLIRSFLDGRAPELTACEQIWEFTHVADAAAGLVALLEAPDARNAFNIGAGEAAPLRDSVLLLRDLIAPTIEPLFGRIPYRPDQVMRLEADISRLSCVTGWRPIIPLERGFSETIAWLRQRRRDAGSGEA